VTERGRRDPTKVGEGNGGRKGGRKGDLLESKLGGKKKKLKKGRCV